MRALTLLVSLAVVAGVALASPLQGKQLIRKQFKLNPRI